MDKYAPVVFRYIVIIMVILKRTYDIKTYYIDLLNDFSEADIPKDKPVYIKISTYFQ